MLCGDVAADAPTNRAPTGEWWRGRETRKGKGEGRRREGGSGGEQNTGGRMVARERGQKRKAEVEARCCTKRVIGMRWCLAGRGPAGVN